MPWSKVADKKYKTIRQSGITKDELAVKRHK
jgi:hypothetical protein